MHFDYDDDLSGRTAEPPSDMRWPIFALCIIVLVFGSALLCGIRYAAGATPPLTLVHADGQQIYDWLCCANHDCQPVDASSVDVTASGWVYKPTGEIVPFEDSSRIKRSDDGRFHVCRPPSGLRCIYIPSLS